MTANERQVGGDHYKNMNEKTGGLQHWDVVHLFDLDYFQGNITKYVMRWRAKGGVEDLKKARHYLDKYIEIHEKLITKMDIDIAALQTGITKVTDEVRTLFEQSNEAEAQAMNEYAESLRAQHSSDEEAVSAIELGTFNACCQMWNTHDSLCVNYDRPVCGAGFNTWSREWGGWLSRTCTLPRDHVGPHGLRPVAGGTGVPPAPPAGGAPTPPAGGHAPDPCDPGL